MVAVICLVGACLVVSCCGVVILTLGRIVSVLELISVLVLLLDLVDELVGCGRSKFHGISVYSNG